MGLYVNLTVSDKMTYVDDDGTIITYDRCQDKPRKFLRALRMGEFYKYPNCCVWEFCVDIINDRLPGRLRGSSMCDHVPCSECKAVQDSYYLHRFLPRFCVN
jgi:hypothetical protein